MTPENDDELFTALAFAGADERDEILKEYFVRVDGADPKVIDEIIKIHRDKYPL